MAEKYLGPVFEIHGGGLDLVFPHHENEIAQSRGAGREFARLWMHNGMLEFTGEKMSKSLGNVVSLREAIDEWGRETLLMLFLGAHWRKPMDFSEETLAGCEGAGGRLPRGVSEPLGGGRLVGAVGRGARRRLQHAAGAGRHARVAGSRAAAARARSLRPRLSGGERRGSRRVARPGGSAGGGARGGDFDSADRIRTEIEEAGWDVRDVAGQPGYQLVPRR